MKDSGADWVGSIPNGWDMRRGKYLFEESSKKGGSDLTLLSPTQAFGVVPQEQLEGVVRVKADTDFTTFKTVSPDDFIISLRSFQGGFEWSHLSGVCSPAYTVFHASNDEVWPAYYARMFKCCAFIEKMDNITRGIREGKNIGYVDFSNTFLPLPPLDEQRRIADYLDERCAAIDEVRRTIEDEVEALRRLRRATIHRAVTKGLDVGVPMRDSGVEWIGETPEAWQVVNSKGVFKARKERARKDDIMLSASQRHGMIPQVQYDDVEGYKTVKVVKDADILKHVEPGDFVISMRSFQGGLEYSAYRGKMSSAYLALHARQGWSIADGYYKHLFKSYRYIISLQRTSNLVRDGQALRYANFVQVKIPYPPVEEQQRVADYLDERCAAIDSVIDTRTKQLQRLEDYRKALVFAYVTGKKEVPTHE